MEADSSIVVVVLEVGAVFQEGQDVGVLPSGAGAVPSEGVHPCFVAGVVLTEVAHPFAAGIASSVGVAVPFGVETVVAVPCAGC